MMMVSRQLQVFACAAQCRSISKAARQLHIVQPAVSNAVAALEDELGVTLLTHDRRQGMLLTPVGEKILSLVLQMQELEERIRETAREENGLLSGRVRIACLSSLISIVLARPLQLFTSAYPQVELQILEGTPSELFELIERHAADFALSCSPFGRFAVQPLQRDHLCAVFPPGQQGTEISLSDPPGRLIVNRPACETLQDFAPHTELRPGHMLLVQNAESAVELVRQGVGIGIISEFTAKTLAPEFERFAVKPDVSFEIGLFATDLKALPPAADRLLRLIGQSFSGAEPPQ
ncbi:MAG: LysR family transcriptional regulator [Proteobacteria bacterium]|uniref:LysR family transcriptional regulator n=1 Tax=Candidatus Avisuccinivibrio stercorigallinarum TaxID=2840704 RepID=A0A9D9GSL4_9GAMM|nr:LysR family transcriptional regulator [Candidatus Avisuccinivibrio stercorigallinarum]